MNGGFIDHLMIQIQQDEGIRGGEKLLNFWAGKEPCWVLLDCSRYVYPECPAYLHPEVPCWSHAFTQSEKLLDIKRECRFCKVFDIYSGKAPPATVNSQRDKFPLK